MGNFYVKLYEIWTSGSGGDVIQSKSLWTDDRQRPSTIAHLDSLAQVS